tara:strand:- start:3865 stop:4131 length:267 start_codon:yes stop_codon:yes gene_type:complete
MILKPWWETRNFTQRFSLGTQNRRSWIFGLKTRLVLLLACETLLPDIARFPVTWQTLAMALTLNAINPKGAIYTRFWAYFLGRHTFQP